MRKTRGERRVCACPNIDTHRQTHRHTRTQPGVDGYGLTEKGKEQAKAAADALKAKIEHTGKLALIVSSDFKRAEETAAILATGVGTTVKIDQRLRWVATGASCLL